MKTSNLTRYILYLLSITAVFFISMLMITIILLRFSTMMFLLGVPVGVLIVLKLRPYIADFIYDEEESEHKDFDKLDNAVQTGALIILYVSIGSIFAHRDTPSYLLGEALRLTGIFTQLFIGGALLLEVIRYIKRRFGEKPTS